jgi:hypothetical protein
MKQVGHQGLAGLQDLLWLRQHIHGQPHVATQLVAKDVKGCLQDPRDRRDGAAFLLELLALWSERVEVIKHRHPAFDQREVVPVRHSRPRRRNIR